MTKEEFEKLNSKERQALWYNSGKEFTHRQWLANLYRSWIEAPKASISEEAKYLTTVYTFKERQVLHLGTYKDIDESLENDLYTSLKWKYKNITPEEFKNILKQII